MDFVWTRGARAIGIEVKASATWRGEYGGALKSLLADGVLTAGHGLYTGSADLKDGDLRIWPLQRFFRELSEGPRGHFFASVLSLADESYPRQEWRETSPGTFIDDAGKLFHFFSAPELVP